MPRDDRVRLGGVTRFLRFVALALLVIVVGSADPMAGSGGTNPTPSKAAVETSDPVVFAHYFPPYPLSLDNAPAEHDYYARNYLTVAGENGIHAAYGGLLRDRPLPVQPGEDDSWQLRNLKIEIDQAKAAGIEGFLVDLLSPQGHNWDTTMTLMHAADEVGGFVVVPMIDATASFGRLPPKEAADRIATLLEHRSAYRTDDGYLLSSFAAERKSVSWWSSVITELETAHQKPITFQAVFLSARLHNMLAFAPIADGFGNWGGRTVAEVVEEPDFAMAAHRLGKTWMAPVAVQDFRPRSYSYAEASNTETLRTMWTAAIDEGADTVQLVTWNDYSESTQFAPSVAHGTCFADISRYYSRWFREHRRPTIEEDALFVTHRMQPVDAQPQLTHRPADPNLGGADTQPRDQVEVLTFLTEPGTIQVTIGAETTSYWAPAGVTARTFELRLGTVSAQLHRADDAVLSVTSPQPVTDHPEVQDLQYYAACTRK